MDYKKYFLDILSFLEPYQDILLYEPLDDFPQRSLAYPTYWREQLDKMNDEQHYRFIHFNEDDGLDKSFTTFQQSIMELTSRIPYQKRVEREFPSWALWKVGKKKQHEIAQLCDFIEKDIGPNKVVDIGGGMGHLARTLAHYYGIPTITIDQSQELQDLGEKRAKKYPLPKNAAPLIFKHKNFTAKLLKDMDYDLSVGLHTCGSLANEHIANHQKCLINFGCCYHKLSKETFPLSGFSKENLNFTYTNEAFTLATRSHYGADINQFYKTKRVKEFRFAFQVLLEKFYGVDHFFSVGSSVNSTYKGNFSTYVIERLLHLKKDLLHTEDELNQFFDLPETKARVREIYLCNIIRWRFGRLLELLIILDRAIWLQEQKTDVTIKAIFNPGISPRNLALITK